MLVSNMRQDSFFEFQPIFDTFKHRVLAYECLPRQDRDTGETLEAARLRSLAIHSAARQTREGLHFFNLEPASIGKPAIGMRSTVLAVSDSGMKPANVVFAVRESDLVREPKRSRHVREYLGRNGFGFALSGLGTGTGLQSFQAVADFEPDYINLDRSASAPAISKLVRIAEKCGAQVVARGVESFGMVENLWLLGVRFMQGQVFAESAAEIALAAS
jgi:EAL domain-containing protein (putative c-di-GMP-specific phosphodiesterase class I)